MRFRRRLKIDAAKQLVLCTRCARVLAEVTHGSVTERQAHELAKAIQDTHDSKRGKHERPL